MHDDQTDSPLYAQALGESWTQLPEPVKRLHRGAAHYRGEFCVTRGSTRLARILGRCLGLPSQGQCVNVDLQVIPFGDREKWVRRFGNEMLTSTQWHAAPGEIFEQIGPIVLHMRLEVSGSGLEYYVQGAKLRFGWLRLPLPSPDASLPAARETPGENGRSIDVHVAARLPWIGLLIEYRGWIAPVESEVSV